MPHKRLATDQTPDLPGIAAEPAADAAVLPRQRERTAASAAVRKAVGTRRGPAPEKQTELSLLSEAIFEHNDLLSDLHLKLKSLQSERGGLEGDVERLVAEIGALERAQEKIRDSEAIEDKYSPSKGEMAESLRLLVEAREAAGLSAGASDAEISGALGAKANRLGMELASVRLRILAKGEEISFLEENVLGAGRRENDLIRRVTHSGSADMAQAGISAAADVLLPR